MILNSIHKDFRDIIQNYMASYVSKKKVLKRFGAIRKNTILVFNFVRLKVGGVAKANFTLFSFLDICHWIHTYLR